MNKEKDGTASAETNATETVQAPVQAEKPAVEKQPKKAPKKKPAGKAPKKKPVVKKAPKAPAKPAAKKAPKKKPAKKAPVKKKPTKKGTEYRTADNSNRNFGRVPFDGELIPKGQAVLRVIAEESKKKGMTLEKLKQKFPDELMPGPWGVLRELAAAKKLSGTKKLRYFLRDRHVLNVSGKKVAVCNQWSSESFSKFAKHVKPLGYNLSIRSK